MSMSIRTNVASLNAQRNLLSTQLTLENSLSRLSSGYRIATASDDAAGLGISVNLEAQIRSYNQASRNAQDGVSVIQTAEGALNEISNIITRLRELAMQSASDGIGNVERGYIQKETDALKTEIDRIANATDYNGFWLLNNSTTSITFQVGIRNIVANDRIQISVVDVNLSSLGLSTLSLSTMANAQSGLAAIDAALQKVSEGRATYGATGNRLTNVIAQIHVASENLSAANSRIRDVDVAEESSRLTHAQILYQAGVSVLAQANASSQIALKLLGQ